MFFFIIIIITIIIIIIIITRTTIIIIIDPENNNNNNPETRKYWVDVPAGDSLVSWGEGSSLGLDGNPSGDGVSMKILVWRHLKPNPQLL